MKIEILKSAKGNDQKQNMNRQFKVPDDRQSKRLTEKTLLQKRMTKIDIAYRIKLSKTAIFSNLFFFLNKALKKPDHEN